MKINMLKDTMVNMKWTDIQDYVNKKALVLIPLGVVEEHGPQLCLGTDIYTAHLQCTFIKEKLFKNGIEAVIAPPFYWGVCQSTGSFIGSFRIRKETAKELLYDIIASLAEFGFRNIYGINAHGDIEQNIALMEAFKEAVTRLEVNGRYLFLENNMHHYGLDGSEPYICPLKSQEVKVSKSKYQDVHGGDIETAVMSHFYPDLTDTDIALSLPPVELGEEKIMTWLFGGHTKELSLNGYVGAPADYKGVDVLGHLNDVADRITKAVMESIV